VPKIRVADFGIAKVAGGFGEKLTQVGAFVGTPQFAAPEQFEGAQPEPATDVYATGAMLYFCLVGKPVAGHMDALEPDQQLEHLLNHLPPKLVIPEGADSEETNELQKLEAVFTRAMAPYPNERCTMAELERSLGELIPGHITHDTSTGSFTREQQSLSKTSCPPNLSKLPVDSRPPTDSRPPDIRESRTPENRRKVEGSSNLGCGLLTVGGMLAGAVLVLLLVSGWWYYTQEDSEPVLLSGTDTDPDKKAEWELITASLRLPAINAIRSCKGPKKFQLDIIYDEKGTLQTLTLIGNTDEVLRSCVANQLLPVMVPRSSDGSVRLTFSL
jgi:serine/threonine protein kinase